MGGSFWSWWRPGPAVGDDAVRADSTTRIAQDMEVLKERLHALEMRQPPTAATGDGRDRHAASERAVPAEAEAAPAKKSVAWRDHSAGNLALGQALGEDDAADNEGGGPPMRKIKFRDTSPRKNPVDNNNNNNSNDNNADGGDDDVYDSGDDSSAFSFEDDPVAFAGWARVFFQARRDRAARQVAVPHGATPACDTYLHLTIRATTHELRIACSDDRWRPPLVDPPIDLSRFYAARVPGSRSGAALFLRRDDDRRLRKYLFRFEFLNRTAPVPPQLYTHFSRSGAAAKNSLRAMHKVKRAMARVGEERREQLQQHRRRGEDAFAAHLADLDELLRESDELAERFVECVNARNEEEELAGISDGKVGHSQRKRAKPLPPYWGSGYNKPNTTRDESDEDDGDSMSDDSEEEEELNYDDDDDDETTFDKVKASTEQTLETLWKNIVK